MGQFGTLSTRRAYHLGASPTHADPVLLRLYRVLLRQCRAFDPPRPTRAAAAVLLQSPLDPNYAGLSRTLESSLSRLVKPHHVLCLWGQNRLQDLQRQRGDSGRATARNPEARSRQIIGKPTTRTSSSSTAADKNAEEEEKILSWMAPWMAENAADAWLDHGSLWTTTDTIQQAIRMAFRTKPECRNDAEISAVDLRRWAIDAYQFLAAQSEMHRLSRCNQESGITVTTLSRCIGKSFAQKTTFLGDEPVAFKFRFVYRIRIENGCTDQWVQLLGRSWIIQGDDASQDVHVNAPQTGAVGQQPVLAPGQAFEYMSGCEIGAERGLMKGCFHLAWVPEGTPSASVGQAVAALDPANDNSRFEVPVAPFPLEPDRLP